MAAIHTNIKEINFLTSALAIFFPDGRVVAVQKIKGFNYHIEYLRVLSRGDKQIKQIMKDEMVEFTYYFENPSEVMNGIFPVFLKNGCAVYMNLTPNVTMPTVESMMFLPEGLCPNMNATFQKMKEKFNLLQFYDIVRYNSSSLSIESCTSEAGFTGVDDLYEILEEMKDKKGKIR